MDKNYYEILEINKNASPEIIKKAYTTLAKKYHPDLQEESGKHNAEEKLKLINEAYDVLSDAEKRNQYDSMLSSSEPDTDKLINENEILKQELNNLKSQKNDSTNNKFAQNIKNQKEYEQELQNARQKAYYDAYIQDLKNRGYKIRYKKTFSDYVKSGISLLITIFILLIIFQIPFVKNYFINLYNENQLIKIFIDTFLNLFKN